MSQEPTEKDIEKASKLFRNFADFEDCTEEEWKDGIRKIASALAAERSELEKENYEIKAELEQYGNRLAKYGGEIEKLKDSLRRERERAIKECADLIRGKSHCHCEDDLLRLLESYQKDASEEK